MLDPPTSVQYNYLKNDTSVLTPTSLKNALEVARQSICLYKNKDNILPLANNSAQSIGVFGASANESILLLGNYYTTPDYHIATILEALSASHPKVSYESGCTTIPCPTANFSAATALAAKSDVLVVVLGLDQSIEAEGHDREDLNLPGNQAALVAALRAAAPNKPLIAVLVHGGTLALGSVADQLDAIVDAWYPGMFGGQAIVDVLFGAYNPAGRTPVTWYKATSQLQPMGNMDLYAGNGTTYRYFRGDVTYPFGFGLSYTTFAYSNLRFESPNATACQNIGLTVTVTNTGKRDGDEVVQAYVRQPGASVPAPRIRLAAFSRVHLAAGASQTVTLTITPQYHSVVYSGADVFHPVQVVERGPIEIHVGGGQPQYYPGAVGGSINILDSRDIRDC